VILLALAAIMIAGAAPSDVDVIRAARAANNAAIAAHDAAAMRPAYTDDYTAITGSFGAVMRGGDAVGARMAAGVFADPKFVTYERIPDVITIATPRDRAMERGHWVGRWIDATLTGEYLAVWVPVGTGWKLRSESFVTLTGTEPKR
jgi:ketosteroid isomerase-like protein